MSDILYHVFYATGECLYHSTLQAVFRNKEHAFKYAWINSIKENLELLDGTNPQYFWGKDMHYEYSVVSWDMERNIEAEQFNIDHDTLFKTLKFKPTEITEIAYQVKNSTIWPFILPPVI